MISRNASKKDPLLGISNQTFVSEQIKSPQLKPIYEEILNNGCSKMFPKYFIHPDSKALMFKRENTYDSSYI